MRVETNTLHNMTFRYDPQMRVTWCEEDLGIWLNEIYEKTNYWEPNINEPPTVFVLAIGGLRIGARTTPPVDGIVKLLQVPATHLYGRLPIDVAGHGALTNVHSFKSKEEQDFLVQVIREAISVGYNVDTSIDAVLQDLLESESLVDGIRQTSFKAPDWPNPGFRVVTTKPSMFSFRQDSAKGVLICEQNKKIVAIPDSASDTMAIIRGDDAYAFNYGGGGRLTPAFRREQGIWGNTYVHVLAQFSAALKIKRKGPSQPQKSLLLRSFSGRLLRMSDDAFKVAILSAKQRFRSQDEQEEQVALAVAALRCFDEWRSPDLGKQNTIAVYLSNSLKQALDSGELVDRSSRL